MLKWSEYDSTPIVEPTSPFPIKEPCKEEPINKLYVYAGEKGETFTCLLEKKDALMWSFDIEDDLKLNIDKYYDDDNIGPNFRIFYKDDDKYFIDIGYVYYAYDDDGYCAYDDDGYYSSQLCKTIELTDYQDNIYKHFFTKWEEIKNPLAIENIWEYEVLNFGERKYEEDKEDCEDDNNEKWDDIEAWKDYKTKCDDEIWLQQQWDYIDIDNKTIRYKLCYDEIIRFKNTEVKNEMMKEYAKLYTRRLVDNVRLFVKI